MLKGVFNAFDKLNSYIIYSVLGIIIISSFILLNLFVNNTHADNITTSVSINSSLTLNIPTSTISLDLDPSTTTFASQNLTVGVGTNNPAGYNLILTTTTTDLTDTEDSTKTIPTLPSSGDDSCSSGCTLSDFPVNHWGYKKDSSNYLPFATNIPLLSSDGPANDDSTTLNFATKIDYKQPAGTYNLALNFALTANPNVQYIQDVTPSSCPDETKQPLLVVDRRDNEEYYIQKLADGNCWMLDNLRLDPTAVSLNDLKGETGEPNTNATDQILTYFKNGGGSSPYPASGVVAKTATGGSWADSYNLPYVATSGTDNGGWTKDTVASVKYGSGSGKIGVYYNYCAASAGSYCYAKSSGAGNAQYDICPAGWRMPAGDTAKGSYYYLFNNTTEGYSANVADFQGAFSVLYPGELDDGSVLGRDYLGAFQSSTNYNGNGMNGLYVNTNSYVTTQEYLSRYSGLSVRCVLDYPAMQNVTASKLNKLMPNIGDSAKLKDSRDGRVYTVAKLADNQIWMTSNLNLPGGTKLYSETSDVPDGYPTSGGTGYYTLPASSTDGFSSNTAAYVYNTGNETTSQTSSASNSYYSWLAATAGSGSSASPDDGGRAAYSICPKGWKLPSATTDGVSRDTNNGYTGGDFYKMITKYMGTGVTTLNNGYYDDTNPNPFNINAGPGTTPNFLLAGYYYSGSFYYGGSGGYYWSSSSGSSTNAYYLYFDSSSAYSANSSFRRVGFPVRCIFAGS